jgi:pimeloyl-ACP methyl ester carboxylesterase
MTRRRKRLIWSLILVPAFLYLAICAFMFFAQTRLLLPVAQVGASGPLPPAAERIEVAAASGERLSGLHIPPARPGGERLLILGFGGNAWNADAMAAQLAELYPEADIVTFHYRGFAPSAGSPGAAAMRDDALRIFDFVRGHYPSRRILAVGFSIGSGVAASLAAHRPLDGLILVTAFDSLGRVAAAQFPWLPVRLLFRNNLDPSEDLAGSRIRVALVSAGGDRLVLPARTQALRDAIPDLVFDRTIAGADHNDIYRNPAFAPAMREALESLLTGSR